MRIVTSCNDPVRLSFLVSLLADAGIDCVVLNQHTSAIGGGISALPRHITVADHDYLQACQVIRDAGEA
ncbi:MAG: DUF2007 domain-containing protein [Acetobacteraceae bacterium]